MNSNSDTVQDDAIKQSTQDHWGKDPCGSNYSESNVGTKDYFDDIESHRYETHAWLKEKLDGFDVQGKSVLEIGFGMGTDHLQLARGGGDMHGIDITARNREVTTQRLELYGFQSNLITGDAESLPYEDNTFDFVYSFGVVHHSPNTDVIVEEVRRVLKPGGSCWIAVYNRYSIFFLWSIFFCQWLINFGFLRQRLADRVSEIEYPNDDPDLLVRLFTKRGFRKLFKNFSHRESGIDHFHPDDVYYFPYYVRTYVSATRMDWLARHFGWYIWVHGTK